jgi:hypothetical protein
LVEKRVRVVVGVEEGGGGDGDDGNDGNADDGG